MKVHYAQSALTACGVDVIAIEKSVVQHTTIDTKVTCKNCKKVIENKTLYKKYIADCQAEADYESDSDDY